MGYYRNLGQADIVAQLYQTVQNVSEPCSWLGTTYDFYFDSSGWQQCQIQAGQAQIQSVADNAKKYYGANSVTAQVAQQTADQQKAQVAADVANVADYYGAGCVDIGQGCGQVGSTVPKWLWLAVAGGGLLVLAMIRR